MQCPARHLTNRHVLHCTVLPAFVLQQKKYMDRLKIMGDIRRLLQPQRGEPGVSAWHAS